MSQVGKVYLVGGGPGDPGLLTLKGRDCLAAADVILYDGLVNPLLLRHTDGQAERTCRVSGPGGRRLDQAEINARLIEAARAGKTVVRLKGGDPYVFGRGSEEAAALEAAGIPYEVVPGITAATAATAYSGISLTHREFASAVAFITGHEDPSKPQSALDYDNLARFPGTLVFYMGLHRLPEISATLVESGKGAETAVAVISRGSWPQQRTVTGTLANISDRVASAGLRAPSLIVVGACVELRETLNWFEKLPLFGQSIGITRPDTQIDAEIDKAIRLGAHPVAMPMIRVRPVDDWSEVDAVIGRLEEFDWLILTSVNGVDSFLGRIWERGGDVRQLAHLRLATIGDATAGRLRDYGLRADLVPEVFRAEALAEALCPHVSGKRVLWARANRGRDVLPREMVAAGATYEEVVVYEHDDVEVLDGEAANLMTAGKLDWIALSSPAIATNLARLLTTFSDAKERPTPKIACISPVTAAAASEAGLSVDVVATEHTWDGLFQAICSVSS